MDVWKNQSLPYPSFYGSLDSCENLILLVYEYILLLLARIKISGCSLEFCAKIQKDNRFC